VSINLLRGAGLAGVIMDYEDGGRTEVYTYKGRQVRLPSPARTEDVIEAFKLVQTPNVNG